MNPFKGADSYTEHDARTLFGRGNEILTLFNLVKNYTTSLLYAKSGVGKTSLINAGLIPALRKNKFFPVVVRLGALNANPDKTYSEVLINLVKEEVEKCNKRPHNEQIEYKLIEGDLNIREVTNHRRLTSYLTNNRVEGHTLQREESKIHELNVVFIFDQFEEIFFLPFDEKQLDDLFFEIRTLADGLIENQLPDEPEEVFFSLQEFVHSKKVRFLFSFREEYFPQIESLSSLLPSLKYSSDARLRLSAFTKQAAQEVIERTLEASGTKPISERDLNKVTDSLIAKHELSFRGGLILPFMLSLICKKIWATENPEDTISKLDQKLDIIITRYVNDCFRSLADEVKTRSFIEDRLISVEGNRVPVRKTEVPKSIYRDIECLTGVLDPDKRLLTLFNDPDQIEIIHDKLIDPLYRSRRLRRELEAREVAKLERKRIADKYRAKILGRAGGLSLLLIATAALSMFIYKTSELEDKLTKLFDNHYSIALENIEQKYGTLAAYLMVDSFRKFVDESFEYTLKHPRDLLSKVDSASKSISGRQLYGRFPPDPTSSQGPFQRSPKLTFKYRVDKDTILLLRDSGNFEKKYVLPKSINPEPFFNPSIKFSSDENFLIIFDEYRSGDNFALDVETKKRIEFNKKDFNDLTKTGSGALLGFEYDYNQNKTFVRVFKTNNNGTSWTEVDQLSNVNSYSPDFLVYQDRNAWYAYPKSGASKFEVQLPRVFTGGIETLGLLVDGSDTVTIVNEKSFFYDRSLLYSIPDTHELDPFFTKFERGLLFIPIVRRSGFNSRDVVVIDISTRKERTFNFPDGFLGVLERKDDCVLVCDGFNNKFLFILKDIRDYKNDVPKSMQYSQNEMREMKISLR